ncbi:MAG: DEAD/DEAH box helicase [Clostridia bacterium]|nr:DEAD/DEAH box helicase [Clostridia bacterium]
MYNEDEIFDRFPPFIREFIFSHSWESLRPVQIAAARSIFGTENNLLLTSATATGKTEAALFPVLSLICEDPPASVGVLYIAPLKSLINDQFERLDALLDLTGIPVTHWHGDVAASHKNRLLSNPEGILQITPESLEAMLINRSNDIPRLFGDLRFIIIDEIHILTGSDRGNQIICQLCRLGRLIGKHPRRIGLSATVGSPELAAKWLSAGSGRETDIPVIPGEKLRWRLGLEHFYIQNTSFSQSSATDTGTSPAESGKALRKAPESVSDTGDVLPEDGAGSGAPDRSRAMIDAGYEYIYDCVRDKRAIVFSNSREETEYVTATLRQIAAKRNEEDIFLIHHGNLSAPIREEAEAKMKDDSLRAVTCATVTMELGIDIGRLERIVQNGSPNSVTSFLQRLGRSGRRGQPPEMMEVFREENPLPNTPLPQLIPWELLRAIAIIQLYIEERFIEPPHFKTLPFSLAFHQTLSVLASSGELKPSALAERILSLPPLSGISRDDYRMLIMSMLEHDFLEMTEEKGLIVGLAGERLLSSFKFYAVFKDSEDYTVRAGSDEIGTITTPPPVGDRFALAGRVWEVEELDVGRKLIYVHKVDGKMEISWPGDYGEIHTKILRRMRRVLEEDTVYPYLMPNARKRLEDARHLAANTGMLKKSLVHLGGYTWCIFPWLGTRAFRTFRKYMTANAGRLGVNGVEFEGCCYITFKLEGGSGRYLVHRMAEDAGRNGIDCMSLVSPSEDPVFEKYDGNIPPTLLRKAYAADRLAPAEAAARMAEIADEMEGDLG